MRALAFFAKWVAIFGVAVILLALVEPALFIGGVYMLGFAFIFSRAGLYFNGAFTMRNLLETLLVLVIIAVYTFSHFLTAGKI